MHCCAARPCRTAKKKTKALLKELGVAYDFIDIDMLSGEKENEALWELGKFNRNGNFPTMVINDDKCIVGYKEDEIREALQS